MTTAALPVRIPATLPGRRYDHRFFTATALLMFATVFIGFSRSYYLAGIFRAPLPSTIIHIHGAVFTAWIVFLVLQASLAATSNMRVHRRLGVGGFVLACLMVVVGVLAATDSLMRAPIIAGRDPRFFYIVPLTDMVVFATLIYFAFRTRTDPASHKRYIYIATTALTIAAIARWPIAFVYRNNPMAALMSDIFLLVLVGYDLWSTHKIHRVTLYAGLFLIFVQQARIPLGHTATWLHFAGWVQTMVK